MQALPKAVNEAHAMKSDNIALCIPPYLNVPTNMSSFSLKIVTKYHQSKFHNQSGQLDGYGYLTAS